VRTRRGFRGAGDEGEGRTLNILHPTFNLKNAWFEEEAAQSH
jgi:hypothetical protein